MLRVLAVLFGVALYIYFIIDVLRTPKDDTRSLPKAVWLLVVVLIPIVGGVLWFALGRVWPSPGSRFGRRRQPLAPDDDPTFLKQIGDEAWIKRMQRRRGDSSS